MNDFVPEKLSDFLPDEDVDNFGYIWKIEQKQHTLELVGYDGKKEMGSIVLEHDQSVEASERIDQLSWVQDRAKVISPDGITLNIMKEAIRKQYEIYGNDE